MNHEQFKQLQAAPHETNLLGIDDLANRTPRTLIFGYTVDRDTFHVYLGADGLIHILLYSELWAPEDSNDDRPRFLILSHTVGENGGVTDNARFTPSKRIYPESCDLEFCQVLRRYSVNLPFTTYSENSDAKRLERFGGYAGYTFEHSGGCPAISLHNALAADPFFPQSSGTGAYVLSSRLAAQAARELDVRYASSGDGTFVNVAEVNAVEVLARARGYLHEMKDVYMPKDLGKRLAEVVFGAYHQFWMSSDMAVGGTFTAVVNLEHAEFVVDPTHQSYVGVPGGHYEKAVLGTYCGRPFLACKTSGNETYIAYSQFGDTERFLKEQLRQFSLTPEAVAA